MRYSLLSRLLLLCPLFLLPFTHPVLASEGSPTLTAKQVREDFRQLYDNLKQGHANLFVNFPEAQYDRRFDEIYSGLNDAMTVLDAKILFQEFVALGRIGHARIGFPDAEFDAYRDQGGLALPLFVRIEGGRWFVSQHFSDLDLPEGVEITQIDQRPVSAWFDDISRHISSDTPELTASLLAYQLPQYLWLLGEVAGQAPKTHRLTLRNKDKTWQVSMSKISRSEIGARIEAATTSDATPPPELRTYRLLEPGLGYLKPGPFYNAEDPTQVWDQSGFVTFVDEAFEYFLENNVEQLVVDLRNNPGGTNSFSDPLIAWFATEPFKFAAKFVVRSSRFSRQGNLDRMASSEAEPSLTATQLEKAYSTHKEGELFDFEIPEAYPREGQRFTGEVFVLVDRSSFSNAVSVAAIVQDYDFGEVIGESTADFATTFGAMESFNLEHSGIQVGFPKAHIIRPSGDLKAGPVVVDAALAGHPLEAAIKRLDGEVN